MTGDSKGAAGVKWYNTPKGRLAILTVLVLIIGGAWWYASKRADCLSRIQFAPAQKNLGESGAYYWLRTEAHPYKGSAPHFQTHSEALTTFMWQ